MHGSVHFQKQVQIKVTQRLNVFQGSSSEPVSVLESSRSLSDFRIFIHSQALDLDSRMIKKKV